MKRICELINWLDVYEFKNVSVITLGNSFVQYTGLQKSTYVLWLTLLF